MTLRLNGIAFDTNEAADPETGACYASADLPSAPHLSVTGGADDVFTPLAIRNWHTSNHTSLYSAKSSRVYRGPSMTRNHRSV